ncbi:helix-turn-helix transcriptional regulator [Novosphingobium terrae]|uniref:helix-turn-helix transcriptional regulator n=1 Tax=Novosphingobium terrae TaxID=2726189 RepID=UPI00197F86E8|nr:PAS domain-containing protein [Novosphingobium terrae]
MPISPPSGPDRPADKTIEILQGVIEVLRNYMPPSLEVVVHDLTRPDSSVVGIVNGHVSGRGASNSILAGPSEDKGFEALMPRDPQDRSTTRVVKDYVSRTRDGRDLQSSTVVVFDDAGEPVSALCVNMDVASVQDLNRRISDYLLPAPQPSPDEGGEGTIDQLIDEIVADAIAHNGGDARRMTKAEKVAAVAAMNARGLFLIRGAVEHVASRLNATKFTIYNYLDELGARRGQG